MHAQKGHGHGNTNGKNPAMKTFQNLFASCDHRCQITEETTAIGVNRSTVPAGRDGATADDQAIVEVFHD